jgi:hypothetical protein
MVAAFTSLSSAQMDEFLGPGSQFCSFIHSLFLSHMRSQGIKQAFLLSLQAWRKLLRSGPAEADGGSFFFAMATDQRSSVGPQPLRHRLRQAEGRRTSQVP